jgi:hypothetical protein
MSTALAIAGVTQVLRDLLNDELINANVAGEVGQSVTVTTLPPDRVVPQNGTEASQLNVFLRHVTANPGWRNEGLPSRDVGGRTRLGNPPLALNLHYVISAYGAEPLHAEILLGHAMQLLHENPAIPRDVLRRSLNIDSDPDDSLPAALRSLATSGLADQVEQIRITQEFLSSEDMSKFWTATLAHYRPCAAYQVSVVLIQKESPKASPLPVLLRQVAARPDLLPTVPLLTAVAPSNKLPVAQLGRAVVLEGMNLSGAAPGVVLDNDKFEIREEIVPGSATARGIPFTIPSARAADFPVGIYRVGLRLQRPGDLQPRDSNQLALTLAPLIDGAPTNVSRGGGIARFRLNVLPAIRRGQLARLALGGQEYVPLPFAGDAATSLDFEIPNLPTTPLPASLVVDGIASPMIDVEARTPVFNVRVQIP